MVSDDANKDNLSKRHKEICSKLCLDVETINSSWENFQAINSRITLEGDPQHWIGCAIYEACWRSVVLNQQIPSINLTNLLRHCNMSLSQFFNNIKTWATMANLPDVFKQKIKNLEDSYAVTYNVFNDYQPLFLKIFKAPRVQEIDQSKHRNRKQKNVPCTPLKIFEFCWTLFITIKREETTYNKDLVASLHVLIVILDWAFKNTFLADRRDLLNHEFIGLPSNWSDNDFIVPDEAPCIINLLCSNEQIITDIKYIKEYPFKNSIKKYFDRGILISNNDEKNDIFDVSVFERNLKSISNTYEINFHKDDLDERIFLAEYRRKLLERDQNRNTNPSLTASPQDGADSPNSAENKKEMVNQARLTPLSGRKYLSPRDSHDRNSFVSPNENITKLNALLNGRRGVPSDALVQLFESCARNPIQNIRNIVTKLCNRFVQAQSQEQTEMANKQAQMGVALFYKFIESILQNEKQIKDRDAISAIVENDIFYECIFACSLEIVIYSHNTASKFPWILDVLQVQPYNFVKVIELIIRSKDQLSRNIIKHLSIMEETLLSSLVWKSDSLIWQAIDMSGLDIPKFEETALPTQLQNDNQHSTLRKILNADSKQVPPSPGPSATDRFQSPVARSDRQQSILPKASHLVILDKNGFAKVIPVVSSETTPPPPPTLPPPQSSPNKTTNETINNKPKRTGGLSIIFRKFYNLAGERLQHLCNQLQIDDVKIKRQMWTAFEESVRSNKCQLIKDRDLDQLLMCAVYMICKLNQSYKRDFAEIMKSYRNQPQATSDIYRQVLLKKKRTEIIDGELIETPEERGDLIKFYNTVAINTLKRFAEKFVRGNDTNNELLLSPLPTFTRQIVSPGVQIRNNVFVKPLESPTTNFGNGKTFNYYFNRSPSKDLRDINKAINGVQGKRLLIENEADMPSSKRVSNRKLQSLIEERRNQNTE